MPSLNHMPISFNVEKLPGKIVHRGPVFGIRKAELRYDLQLIFSLSHELETPLQLNVSHKKVDFYHI